MDYFNVLESNIIILKSYETNPIKTQSSHQNVSYLKTDNKYPEQQKL